MDFLKVGSLNNVCTNWKYFVLFTLVEIKFMLKHFCTNKFRKFFALFTLVKAKVEAKSVNGTWNKNGQS